MKQDKSVGKGRKITRRGLVRGGIFLSLGAFAGERWATAFEPGFVEVEQVELSLPRLEKPFDGFRLAQLSDIHLGGGLEQERLDYFVESTNALGADAIVITGDFISSNAWLQEEKLASSLGKLHAPDGVFAVLGNHDHWSDADSVRRALRAANVIELPNAAHTLRRGNAVLTIAGVDDAMCGLHDIQRAARQIPKTGAAILLAHEPDFADEFSRLGRFDLQLSGHSHAGQICMPISGPIVLPQHAKKYPRGHYDVGGMQLYTNRGLGSSGIHVRLNCRPEISLFTLRRG
jgi:uncharacterized protein